ncbi:hypothetical protein [Nonomuraea jabiensis]|uniref:hypothetical protein n=1 Tax=Nonomuraea jabiensis TaxID=882448 RepID=UPI003D7656F6
MDVIAEAVELIRNATCPGDYDQAWELVGKATEDRQAAAGRGFALVRSPDPAERRIGCDLLDNGGFSANTLTAIACLGDAALVPYLEDFEEDQGITEALGECDPASRAARDAFAADLAEALHARLPELDFGVYGEICEPGLTLAACGDRHHWSIERLRDRAGGDPVRAAHLVADGLPQSESPSDAA